MYLLPFADRPVPVYGGGYSTGRTRNAVADAAVGGAIGGGTAEGVGMTDDEELTPEQQADFDRLAAEVAASWPTELIAAIHAENGVTSGMVCLRCRKLVRSNGGGNLFCAYHDERPGAK